MSNLERKVQGAQRRLQLNTWGDAFALSIFIAAIAWIVVVGLDRCFALGLPLVSLGIGAALGALIAAALMTAYAGIDALAAAVTLDRAAGLKERVSTALSVARNPDGFSQAALHDAERVAGTIDVRSFVPLQVSPRWGWSAATLATAAIFFFAMPQMDLLAGDDAADDADQQVAAVEERQAVKDAVQVQLKELQQKISDKPGMEELQGKIANVKLPEEPNLSPEDIRREAVKQLDDLGNEMEKKLEAKAAIDELKKQLAKLKTSEAQRQQSKEAAKLAEALQKGDLAAANDALKDIKNQLEQAAEQAQDPEKQRQLDDMQKQLDALAKQLKELANNDNILKDLQNKAGLSKEQAEKLMEQMQNMSPQELQQKLQQALQNSGMTQQQMQQLAQKMQQNQQVQQKLQQMAQQMQQAAQACQQCQNAGQQGNQNGAQQASQMGQQAMNQLGNQLSQLEMAQQAMQDLQSQLNQLQDLKDGISRGQCEGDGQGFNRDPIDPNKIGQQGGNKGYGYGSRIGKERGAHNYRSDRSGSQNQRGDIIGQMLIDGPQVRGEARAEAVDAVGVAVAEAQDAIEREDVPAQYHRVVQEYFERLAGLQSRMQAPASNEPSPKSDDEGS